MILKWKDTWRFVSIYLLGYLILCVVLFVGMKWYRQKNYSPEKLETMLSSVSSKRDKTDDPCKYAIYGEPATAQLQYVKVNIFCSGKSRSVNSMDMRAIKEKTVIGAIKELARVNNFPIEISKNKIVVGNRSDLKNDSWICLQNRVKIENFDDQLVQKGTIDCFNGLTETEITKFYETL